VGQGAEVLVPGVGISVVVGASVDG